MARWTGSDVAEFGSVIMRHATKMERLVADLLRLARLDAHQETLTLAPCDLDSVFEGIVQDLKPLIDSKRQQVVIHVARRRRTAWWRTAASSTTSSATWSRTP